MKSPEDTVVESFKAHLESKFLALDEEITVIGEFPDPQSQYSTPTVSITTMGTPQLINRMPTICKKSDNDTNPDNLDVIYDMGQYNIKLQVDIWTEYKYDRSRIYQLFLDIMDAQFIEEERSTGLSLELLEYHGAIARYDQVSYNYMDGEESSQRGEWRVMIGLEVNFPRLRLKTQPKIKEAKITHDITETDFDEGNEEVKIVFE